MGCVSFTGLGHRGPLLHLQRQVETTRVWGSTTTHHPITGDLCRLRSTLTLVPRSDYVGFVSEVTPRCTYGSLRVFLHLNLVQIIVRRFFSILSTPNFVYGLWKDSFSPDPSGDRTWVPGTGRRARSRSTDSCPKVRCFTETTPHVVNLLNGHWRRVYDSLPFVSYSLHFTLVCDKNIDRTESFPVGPRTRGTPTEVFLFVGSDVRVWRQKTGRKPILCDTRNSSGLNRIWGSRCRTTRCYSTTRLIDFNDSESKE